MEIYRWDCKDERVSSDGEWVLLEYHERIVAALQAPCSGCGQPGHKANEANGDPGQTRFCLTCSLQAQLDALSWRLIMADMEDLAEVQR